MGVSYPAPSSFMKRNIMDGIFVVEALIEVDQLMNVEFANLSQA